MFFEFYQFRNEQRMQFYRLKNGLHSPKKQLAFLLNEKKLFDVLACKSYYVHGRDNES